MKKFVGFLVVSLCLLSSVSWSSEQDMSELRRILSPDSNPAPQDQAFTQFTEKLKQSELSPQELVELYNRIDRNRTTLTGGVLDKLSLGATVRGMTRSKESKAALKLILLRGMTPRDKALSCKAYRESNLGNVVDEIEEFSLVATQVDSREFVGKIRSAGGKVPNFKSAGAFNKATSADGADGNDVEYCRQVFASQAGKKADPSASAFRDAVEVIGSGTKAEAAQ